MISIIESVLGITILNEIGKSPAMKEKLEYEGNRYYDASKNFPSDSKERKILLSATQKAYSLRDSINQRMKNRSPKYNMESVRFFGDKQHPERVQNRANNMLQRAQGGKKV